MERRKKTLLILGLCIFTLALVGLSYALWVITLEQTDENVVYTECLDLEFVGEDNINLQNTYPIPQEELESFFASETPYHFTITNKCESKANLSINLETLKVDNPLEDKWIDVILYEGTEVYEKNVTNVLNNADDKGYYKLTASEKNQNKLLKDSIKAYTLHNFTINNGEKKEFSMYLFVDEETPLETEEGQNTSNTHWKGKVTINAAYKPPSNTEGMLRKINTNGTFQIDEQGMWKYNEYITKIVFENKLIPHTDAKYHFDESADQDESVMSYLVENADKEGKYTAYLQGDGKIIANPDSSNLFRGFGYVESIDGLEYFDTSQVTNMSWMFSLNYEIPASYGTTVTSIESLDLNPLDTSHVTDMSYMFNAMNELTSLNLGEKFDTSSVINMSHMFSGLRNLTNLNLGNQFNTSQVEIMDYMFWNLRALPSLDLGKKFDTRNVTNMNAIFSGLESIATLNLPECFVTDKVTDMSFMFANMESLDSLDLGSHFDTSQVENMNSMFYHMQSLTNLDLGDHFDTSNVTDMSYMFSNLKNLPELNFGEYFDTGQVEKMEDMFSSLDSLTELNLPESMNTSQVTDMSGMFYNLKKLTALNLPKTFDTSQVEDMGHMFSGMSQLTTLDLSQCNFNTSKVNSMSHMFYLDSSLITINYGEYFIHKDGVNLYNMFKDCFANKPDETTDSSWQGVTWN